MSKMFMLSRLVYFLGVAELAVSVSPVCTSKQVTATAPHRNVWRPLSDQELSSINTLLYAGSSGLNLTATTSFGFGGGPSNTLAGVDLLPPNKTDVLFYLNGGTAPDRYAFATVVFGAAAQPYQQDFIVGPLPVTKDTKIQPRAFSTRKDGRVTSHGPNFGAKFTYGPTVVASARPVLKALWNMTDQDLNRVTVGGFAMPDQSNGKATTWFEFTNNPTGTSDSSTLLSLGLYVRVDTSSNEVSKWKATGWLYNNILYQSLDALSTAMKAPGFERLGINVDGAWAGTDRQGDRIPMDDQPPPVAVQPGPPRFSIDPAENYVSWMDFSFYITRTRDMGLKLFDIQYKGKRIIYELGMEEAMAHYASNNPIHSRTLYYDTQYAFGADMVSLVRGYDCPAYSTYLNFPAMQGGFGGSPSPLTDGACLFEMDTGFPIRRHSTMTGSTSISKNIAFVLRTVSTVANYDYMTSYEFYMDGSIVVSMRASGYIESAYWANNEEYGFKIHDNLSGSLHDHVITFKADFDILGEKNSVQKIDIVPTTETYPWTDGKTLNTMKAIKSFVKNEDEAKINWSPNGDTIYAIVNKDQKTKLGEYPGYRIAPATGVIHLTVQNSTIGRNAVNQASHHLYVTKQKDTEARASNPSNLFDPDAPLVNFAKYFNGESLDQEDLVVWFNLGMHHMPHTGDLPNTMFSTAHSSIIISPLNYLPGDPSSATTQQIRVGKGANGQSAGITKFGAVAAKCSVDLGQPDGATGSM